ncbi:MAG: bifunctional DNA-formamidopyrimidine glycosylase/DNA-(apurinic or apyrimidinic site) lyase [Bulleidia sp.]
MPELPEVETVVRTLEHQISGACITDVEVRYSPIINGDPEEFRNRLIGNHFQRFERRGKYLIFRMDDCTLVSHLRMEGKFYIQKPEDPINRHMHVIIQLEDGRSLRYMDTRKFGRMEILPLTYDFSSYHDLGPEPFDPCFDASYLHAMRQGRSVPLKTFLLDQSVIAGIGNIYADEILFACGLRPGRSVRRITRLDEEHIVCETKRILKEAIEAGGTTIRSYTSSLGVTGRFQLSCMVHTMKTCRVCGSTIRVKYIGGRSSYYCPVCQK